MKINLFADSACDLPSAYFEENDVTLIPLRVHIDENNYEDLINIQPNEVFNEIRAGKIPKTSQASPQLFEELFTTLAKSGNSGIYIAFSSELSGTYSTAVMVRDQVKEQYPTLDLTIIDSKCASLGLGIVVKQAVEMIKNGASKESIVSEATTRCQHMEHLFTVEDLEYLAKGGRVSRASAFLGGLLNIKPLLHVDDGKLIPIEKIRGRKKLLKRILELMDERGVDLSEQIIGISHGDDEESALEMKQFIQERFHPKEIYVNIIGSVIGAHAGPGTLAIFFSNQSPKST
ncbi:DegV family protein with EDD domain [Bacillus pakistanensis]|uniref:DegV family protein with EDD domain n=1 Tax=Rossellomorea pakistanensis TaxID=992288 RepID=A0ABS2NF98_9BACI|nr:DegV family protein [Bacillus pakistanensis]MBM7586495.1 DegV family protein with EDD domain [Bacillus pakistanensis]